MGEGKAGLHTGLEAAGGRPLGSGNWQALHPGPRFQRVYQFWVRK